MPNALVWFRNDLRLRDNPSLTSGIRYAESHGGRVECVYVIDPHWFGETSFGFQRIGGFRRRFLRESLEDLDASLRKIGGRLSIVRGPTAETIAKVAGQTETARVFGQHEFASEEKAIEKRVRRVLSRAGIELEVCSANTLFAVDALPFAVSEVPDVFSKFRRKVEKSCDVDAPLPAPVAIDGGRGFEAELALDEVDELSGSADEGDERSVMVFHGGETRGQQRLQEYFFATDSLRRYKETRNGMLGANYSSKFSPWLAMGCLSPRWIAHEVYRYEAERCKNDSTYWLIFELLWRDYFTFVVAKHGRRVFAASGLRGLRLPWKEDWERFDAWRDGCTGFPLIDANMRELRNTGFMSNRGRQNVASFLTKNLGIDWRQGAEWFESQLIDYDPCSNYGNWNYTAGIGNDPRGFRWFNTFKQAEQYDREGEYVRHWLPELASVPQKFVHCPWEMHSSEQKRSKCTIGVDYPAPIVDLFKSASHHEQLYDNA
ncbi:MAG: DASH family cryptochrome [Planctomycetota bacterium]